MITQEELKDPLHARDPFTNLPWCGAPEGFVTLVGASVTCPSCRDVTTD